MRKKKIVQIASVVMATTVLTITAFASVGKTGGYEAVKDTLQSVKSMKQDMKNGTIMINAEVQDNGKVVAQVDGTAKMDQDNKAMSGTFTFSIDDVTKSIAMYKNDETHIMVDQVSDKYYQMKKPEGFEDFRGKRHGGGFIEEHAERTDKAMTAGQEALVDFLVGDLKDNFTLKAEENGNKIIKFKAVEQDIPVPVNLIISAMASVDKPMDKKMHKVPMGMSDITLFEGMDEALKAMPRLQEDVKILSIDVEIMLDSNDQVIGNTFTFQVAGRDAAGKQHDIQVTGSMTITDVNETIVDTIDLSDKDVKVIDMKGHKDIMEQ